MRYANNSQYKSDTLIRKEGIYMLSSNYYQYSLCKWYFDGWIKKNHYWIWNNEVKINWFIVYREDDRNWPAPDKVGR